MVNKYDEKLIGKRIQTERKLLNLNQEELCEKLSIGRTMLSLYETGKRIPDLDILLAMCEVFQCEIGYLLGEYDCKTKTATDVHAITGLSENAIAILAKNKEHAKDIAKAMEEEVDASDAWYLYPEGVIPIEDPCIDMLNYIFENPNHVELFRLIDEYKFLIGGQKELSKNPNYSSIVEAFRSTSKHYGIAFETNRRWFVEQLERNVGQPVEKADAYYQGMKNLESIKAIEYAISNTFMDIVKAYTEESGGN